MVVPSATLHAVGLDPVQVTDIKLFHAKHGNRLYRLRCDGRSWVLKCFAVGEGAVEARGYGLLERLGVPTLPVHGRAQDTLTVAAQRSRLPGWAGGPLEQVRSSALEQSLRRALETL